MISPILTRLALAIVVVALAITANSVFSGSSSNPRNPAPKKGTTTMDDKPTTASLPTTEAEWKSRLTPEQFRILREKGTERAFTGANWDNHKTGQYFCAGCDTLLFNSGDKFDSGTGWPSFTKSATATSVDEHSDRSWGMTRTEIVCATCKGHLGHVFPDGPAPTGLRYCMNGNAMKFVEAPKADK